MFFHNAFAVELGTLCTTNPCTINGTYNGQNITNNQHFTSNSNIDITTKLNDFINNSTINLTNNAFIRINGDGNSIQNFINYGRIETTNPYSLDTTSTGNGGYKNIINYGYISGYLFLAASESSQSNITTITNYGTMSGIKHNGGGSKVVTIDNRGVINQVNDSSSSKYHFNTNLNIVYYTMLINKNPNEFNSFTAQNLTLDAKHNSHIIFEGNRQYGVGFTSSKSKILLDFGADFEFGNAYSLDKLIINTNGNSIQVGNLFSRLSTKSDLYTLTQSGNFFIVNAEPQLSTIGQFYKANVKTMNTLFLQSNAMIGKMQFKENVSKGKKAQRNTQNKRGKKARNKENYYGDEYYVALMPFASYNSFAESGRYNLSGFETGLLGVLGKRINSVSNAGVHFGVSYSNLDDRDDEEFTIKSINAMIGGNYKRNLARGFFLKGRGDFFYFINEVSSFSLGETIKPNNMGFGLGVSGGKDFDIGKDKLSVALGVDYKGFNTAQTTTTNEETYKKGLYNLVYLDFGANYDKNLRTRLGMIGLNANAGVRGSVLGDTLAQSQVIIKSGKSFDMSIDDDKVLGYVNLGVGYEFMLRKIQSELSLVYNASVGDKSMSNGGGVEFKMIW